MDPRDGHRRPRQRGFSAPCRISQLPIANLPIFNRTQKLVARQGFAIGGKLALSDISFFIFDFLTAQIANLLLPPLSALGA
ncbi:MAG TPA: hypothetical protein PLW65_27640 [Pseudomonadota bacterium]|nr:hypothetical protein [Pseudomonadota bacterium]